MPEQLREFTDVRELQRQAQSSRLFAVCCSLSARHSSFKIRAINSNVSQTQEDV